MSCIITQSLCTVVSCSHLRSSHQMVDRVGRKCVQGLISTQYVSEVNRISATG